MCTSSNLALALSTFLFKNVFMKEPCGDLRAEMLGDWHSKEHSEQHSKEPSKQNSEEEPSISTR